jgi:hypothetical protein
MMTTSTPVGSAARPDRFHRVVESLPHRILGVIRAPRLTLHAVAENPQWVDVLAVTFIVSVLVGAVLLWTDVGRLALLDQWERTAVAFGQHLNEAQYAAIVEASRNGAAYATLSALVKGPLLVFGLSALLLATFTGTRDHPVSYQQVLATVAHASVILVVRQVIVTPVNYARETLASPTTLNLFFTSLDEASPLARFLGVVDLFVIWWLSVLAVGVSILYRRPVQTIALTFVGGYVVFALTVAVIMAVIGGTA